eukprot:363234-Chlamydomonas_euryale.AAC.1
MATTVIPSAAMSLRERRMSDEAVESSPDVGSSRKRRLGWPTSSAQGCPGGARGEEGGQGM